MICRARLGLFSQDEDHRQAVALRAQADSASSTFPAAVLELKTEAACSHARVSAAELTGAVRAAENPPTAARRSSLV